MAETTPIPTADKVQPKPSSGRRMFKVVLAVLILAVLAAGGFAAGVYLKVIDLPGLAQKHKLHEYPVIGRYFPQPLTNFEPVELDDSAEPPPPPVLPAAPPAAAPPGPAGQLGEQTPAAPLSEEARLLLLKKQQEEAKLISRQARIYGGMKPEEVVPIMNQLDDGTVIAILNKMEEEQVAKLMAQFDAKRAARLTQSMLKGKPQPLNP